MPTNQNVGQLLRAARERRGESLRGAASGLGVDPSHLLRVEAGRKHPSSELRRAASDYFGLDPDAVVLAAGSAPADILEILHQNPALVAEIRARYGRR